MPPGKVLPLAQAAGLSAAHVGAVVAAALVKHFIGALQDIGAGGDIAVVGAHIVGGGSHDRGKDIVRRQRTQDEVGIAGGGDVVGVQAAGVGEGGSGAADTGGFLVHHRHKIVDAAAAYIVGHDVGGLVGAGQHHGVQQIAQGLGLALTDVRRGGVGRFLPDQVVDIAGGRHADGVQLVLIVLQQQQGGHHLGQAGGLQRGLAVFLVDHDIGIQVDHVGRRGHDVGRNIRRRAVDPLSRHRQSQHDHQHKGAQHRAEFFHRHGFLLVDIRY